MYGLSVKQILKRLKVSAIISIIITVAFLAAFFFLGVAEVGINQQSMEFLLEIIAVIILMPLLFTWEIMAYILNWKKIFKGLLIPIPFVSMLVETVKGYVMAAKAIIFALKNKE